MHDLPLILKCEKIEINEFFNLNLHENKEKLDQGLCSMEIPLQNIELPFFSDKQTQSLQIHKINDFNNWRQELESEIIHREEDQKLLNWLERLL